MEQKTKVKIFDQIVEIMRLRRELGYEPILLLIKPKAYEILKEECGRVMYIYSDEGLKTFMGLQIIIHNKIQHFTIVDNRSWYQ